jgi:hypothetical protein
MNTNNLKGESMKLILLLSLLCFVSHGAYAAALPCEATVLANAINELKNSDNCIENGGCSTFGGTVTKVDDNQYKVEVPFNYTANGKNAEHWVENFKVTTTPTSEGCNVDNSFSTEKR